MVKNQSPKITSEQSKRLVETLSRSATESGFRSDHWTCRRILHVIRCDFGVCCAPRDLKSLLPKALFKVRERIVVSVQLVQASVPQVKTIVGGRYPSKTDKSRAA